MAIELLDPTTTAALKRAPLTYSRDVIASASPPAGYRALRRERLLRTGDLAAASESLLRWEVHAGAGLHVAASTAVVALGEVVVLTMGVGRLGVRAPCRIVEVTDEPDRRGFSYGTLPGHPESGEESFMLERYGDDALMFRVEAVSRPASLLARLGGPVTRGVQSTMTDRYLRAAARRVVP